MIQVARRIYLSRLAIAHFTTGIQSGAVAFESQGGSYDNGCNVSAGTHVF
jgi:hypothetical protein